MIERLHIENFQSLQTVDIELGRFTVLVGPSNSGKSAIRRALEAIVHNDPVTGRLREGCPGYVVSIALDGTFVSIHKTKKATTYQAGEQLIEKPGASAAPAVLESLRLSSTNFASQFDLPFLLAETPSVVARTLGELTNISVLFEGIREATRRQREAGKRAKVLTEQADVLVDKLAVYADLPSEKLVLDNAHAKLTVAAGAHNQATALQEALRAAERFVVTVGEHGAALAQQPDWDYIEGTTAAIEETLAEAAMADAAHRRAVGLVAEISTLRDELDNIAVPEVDFEFIEATTKLTEGWRRAQALLKEIATAMAAAVWTTPEEEAAEVELHEIDQCPLCGAPIYEGMTI